MININCLNSKTKIYKMHEKRTRKIEGKYNLLKKKKNPQIRLKCFIKQDKEYKMGREFIYCIIINKY